MEWEAQEEGFMAKILLPSGSKDIAVGTPVAVLVEEASEVANYKDYTPGGAGSLSVPFGCIFLFHGANSSLREVRSSRLLGAVEESLALVTHALNFNTYYTQATPSQQTLRLRLPSQPPPRPRPPPPLAPPIRRIRSWACRLCRPP